MHGAHQRQTSEHPEDQDVRDRIDIDEEAADQRSVEEVMGRLHDQIQIRLLSTACRDAAQEYGGGANAVVIRNTNYAWPITRALDRSNNVIAYDYATRMNGISGEMERWLEAVRYGYGNQFDRRVTFEYEDRPDKSYGWWHGTPRESLRRLKTVTMQLNMPPQGWQTARSYTLVYTNIGATGLSKLASLTECGLGTDCKQATTFYWTQGGNGFQAGVAQSAAVPSSASSMLIAADLNGDGRSDLAYPEAGPSGQTQNGVWKYVIATASNANKPYATVRNAGTTARHPASACGQRG